MTGSEKLASPAAPPTQELAAVSDYRPEVVGAFRPPTVGKDAGRVFKEE